MGGNRWSFFGGPWCFPTIWSWTSRWLGFVAREQGVGVRLLRVPSPRAKPPPFSLWRNIYCSHVPTHNVPQNLLFFVFLFLKFKKRQQLRKEEACCKTHLSSSSIRFRGLCLLVFFHIFYPQFWYTQTLRRDPVGIGNPVSYQQKGSWCQFQGGSLCDTTCRRLDPNLCRQWQRRKKTTMMMVCYESQAKMIYAPQWWIGRIQIQTLESLLSDIELLMAGCHIFVLKHQSWKCVGQAFLKLHIPFEQ